jgi:hypothetical protein
MSTLDDNSISQLSRDSGEYVKKQKERSKSLPARSKTPKKLKRDKVSPIELGEVKSSNVQLQRILESLEIR